MKHVKSYIKEYPRPQLVRPDWCNLNGSWNFSFGEETTIEDALKGKLSRKICVPYCYETEKSGIGETAPHSVVWYSRNIEGKRNKKTLLHFEGADYLTEVFIDGCKVGIHRGGYSRFTFDITKYLLENKQSILTVCCTDKNDPIQVRGKQRWEKENFGCWYVQTTGIYKTVWLEYLEECYLTSLKITPSIVDYSIKFDASVSAPSDDIQIYIDIFYADKKIQSASFLACDQNNSINIELNSRKLTYQVELWSFDNPNLYDVEVSLKKDGKVLDKVGSYFGLRAFEAKDGKLLLNNLPIYERLLLDQGYWQESGLTPPDEEALIKDILLAKEMGFNGVRKHQKVEDERFFYYADILGFAVWCELPSNHWCSDAASQQITEEWLNIVRQNYNHPSLITWVIFNESWGVRNIYRNEVQKNLATGLYYLTKSMDPMRPVISNDGWMHTKSDILTIHHYEQDGNKLFTLYDTKEKITSGNVGNSQFLPFSDGYKYEGQPIVFSEFGGTAYTIDEENGWGYGNGVRNDVEFIQRLKGLVEAIEKMNISGYCYTQITDVQQEVNGLLRENRSAKVDLKEIAKINKKNA